MSDIGAMVSELISAGCTPEVAAKVVAQAFVAGAASAPVRVTSADETVTRRKENDRIRQQKRRDNLRTSADYRDNPQMSQSASLSSSTPSLERERERKVASRGQRLPDDWVPSPQDQATAFALIGEPRTAAELEKFRDHWKQQPGSKGVKLDWEAAWRNWIRRASEYGGNRNGHQAGSKIIQAADDLRRKIASFDGPASQDFDVCDGASAPAPRLLSDRGRQ